MVPHQTGYLPIWRCPRTASKVRAPIGASTSATPSITYSPRPPDRRLTVGDERHAGLAADLVDDLQHAFAVGPVLHAELLHEPAVVDQVVSGSRLPAGFLVKGDLGVGQELAHQIGNLAQTDRDAAGVVDPLLGLVGHDYPREDFGDLVDMDRAAHRILVRERDRLAARREGDAFNVVDRADD